MPYIENNLNTGEKINHFAKPSIKPTILVLTVAVKLITDLTLNPSDLFSFQLMNH